MVAGKYNMYIEQGADFAFTAAFTDTEAGPIDFTGHTFRGKIRKTPSEADVLAEFTFVVPDQTVPANLGKVVVMLSAAASSAIAVDDSEDPVRTDSVYAYDIESEASGTVVRWLQGTCTIDPEVTK